MSETQTADERELAEAIRALNDLHCDPNHKPRGGTAEERAAAWRRIDAASIKVSRKDVRK